jgi:hypothetical protein
LNILDAVGVAFLAGSPFVALDAQVWILQQLLQEPAPIFVQGDALPLVDPSARSVSSLAQLFSGQV